MSRTRRSSGVDATPCISSLGSLGSPEVALELRDLLRTVDPNLEAFEHGLHALDERHGSAVYAELIHLLSDLQFEPDAARRHWESVRGRWAEMRSDLDHDIDVRVALLSYFVDVLPSLEQPKIIEFDRYERACDSAYRDGLSGLFNYRFMLEFLGRELIRGDREGTALSLLMLDVDDFKPFNDRHGHLRGNELLVRVAETLASNVRATDLAARYGGEEFVLVLPATSKSAGRLVAERVRREIARLRAPGHPSTSITVSVGVATFPADARDVRTLIDCADRAMYDAKRSGKNRVELFEKHCRSFRRYAVDLHGRCASLAGTRGHVHIDTLSEGGMTFESEVEFEPGTTCEIAVALPTGESLDVVARVVARIPSDRGDAKVGSMFLHMDNQHRRRLREYLESRTPVA